MSYNLVMEYQDGPATFTTSSLKGVWKELYLSDEMEPPGRVRIGRLFPGNMVQAQFEGSYPGALMWLLGLHRLPSEQRMNLERQLKDALCKQEDCRDGQEEGQKDRVADSGE